MTRVFYKYSVNKSPTEDYVQEFNHKKIKNGHWCNFSWCVQIRHQSQRHQWHVVNLKISSKNL